MPRINLPANSTHLKHRFCPADSLRENFFKSFPEPFAFSPMICDPIPIAANFRLPKAGR
jgi:hypothetical protein